MDNLSIERACEMIQQSNSMKRELVPEWNFADDYYNNTVSPVDRYGKRDPTRLIDWHIRQDHFDNNIPHLIRKFAAWVVGQPFDILVKPEGNQNDYLHILAANGTQDCLQYFKTRPKFLDDLREISIRMKVYNAVAEVDYYDSINEQPASRIIPHTDIFLDPTARRNVNEVGGPKSVALRMMLYKDEAINRFGAEAVAKMTPGLLDLQSTADPRNPGYPGRVDTDHYGRMYDVFEWYGYDYSFVAIPKEESEEMARTEIMTFLQLPPGTMPQVDLEIDHEVAIETATEILNLWAGQPKNTSLEETFSTLGMMGLGQIVERYKEYIDVQQGLLEDGEPGGSRPKFSDYVYKAEFQYGTTNFLSEPEPLDYPHGQIPVSFYRNHVTSNGLFGHGPFNEVANVHRRLELYEDALYTYVDYASRPPFIVDLDLLHPDYADETKLGGMIRAFKEGFRVLFIRSGKSQGAKLPDFAKPAPMSIDVMRVIEYLRYRIEDIIGPVPVMSGDVSGEVSGRAYSLRQQAAAKPLNDVIVQIEGPKQQGLHRMSTYILNYLPFEKIAAISGQENAGAIMELRESEEYLRCATTVKFGRGMPTDWETLEAHARWALESGLTTPEEYAKVVDSPIELKSPAPMPSGPGGQPGGQQGANLLQGMM